MDNHASTSRGDAVTCLCRDVQIVHKALQRGLRCIITQASTIDAKHVQHFHQFGNLFLECFAGHRSFKLTILLQSLVDAGSLQQDQYRFLEYRLGCLQLLADSLKRSYALPYSGEDVGDAAAALMEAMTELYEYEMAIMYPCIMNRTPPEVLQAISKKTQIPAVLGKQTTILPFLHHNLRESEAAEVLQKSWLSSSMLSLSTIQLRKALRHSWIYAPSTPADADTSAAPTLHHSVTTSTLNHGLSTSTRHASTPSLRSLGSGGSAV